MDAQNQLTKKVIILSLSILAVALPAAVEPLSFSSPFTQDVEIFVETKFSQDELKDLGNQEELFIELVKEAEAHPDMIESLPPELQAEIQNWIKRGKSI